MNVDQGDLERYTLPPAGATTAQESGLSQWQTTLAREEIENWEGVFGEPYHKPAFKGAAQPALDLVFENPEQLSPEAIVLFEEFRRERKTLPRESRDLKTKFSEWVSEDVSRELKKDHKPDHYPPTEIVLDPYQVSFDVVDFKELWRSPETRVFCVFHPAGKGRHLEFRGRLKSGKTANIQVKVGELAESAFGQEIIFGTPQTDEEKQEFWKKIKSLRVDDKPLAAEKMDFVYPIYLFLKTEQLQRKFPPKERARIERFNRFWQEGKPFLSIGFGFKDGAIRGVALQKGVGTRREVAHLPFDIFRSVYGVIRFNGRENGRRAEGADFGEMARLTPATPCEKFIDIVSSISINRTKLPPRTRIVATDFSQRKPAGLTIGYT